MVGAAGCQAARLDAACESASRSARRNRRATARHERAYDRSRVEAGSHCLEAALVRAHQTGNATQASDSGSNERWDTSEVGWCETDTVAHCGESGEGEFAFSVNLTDVASTWTETRAVLDLMRRDKPATGKESL